MYRYRIYRYARGIIGRKVLSVVSAPAPSPIRFGGARDGGVFSATHDSAGGRVRLFGFHSVSRLLPPPGITILPPPQKNQPVFNQEILKKTFNILLKPSITFLLKRRTLQ